MNRSERLISPRSFETNESESSQLFPGTPQGSSEESVHSSQCHDSKSLLEMWSGLHTDQISSGAGNGYPTGDDEMLVVRNTFLELCKLAEKQGVHNPDRFVSAPAAYSFPGSPPPAQKSPERLRAPPIQENAYNFPPLSLIHI